MPKYIIGQSPSEDVSGDPPSDDENTDGDDDRDAVERVIKPWKAGLERNGNQQGEDVGNAQYKECVGLKSFVNIEIQQVVNNSLAAAARTLETGRLKEYALGKP